MTIDDIIKEISGADDSTIYDNTGKVALWNSWYTGKVADFHSYKVFNGKKHVDMTRFSLGMAKRACEDWANLLINEKTDIVLSNAEDQKKLNDILKNCKFWRKANEGIEKSFALGMGALVVRIDDILEDTKGNIILDSGKINVSFINATKIKPLTIEDGCVTECAFINAGNKETHISIHLLDKATHTYKIHNIKAKGKDAKNLSFNKDEDYYIFDTKSSIPWFAIIKPNISNNIDINSPLGISIFANAIDTLKEIDIIYDSFAYEFALGRKRIFINARDTQVDPVTGEVSDVFDSNDLAIYVLPESDDGKQTFYDNTQVLRVNEHEIGIQTQLNLYSYACGFGTNHYKFNGGSVATATQIVSENSDMFRNLKKHEIIIEEALTTIMEAIIYASNTFTTNKISAGSSIEIKFDDSIIEDKQAEKTNDRLDVSLGVMSKAEYRAKWFAEDIKEAEAKIHEMENMTIDEPFGGGLYEGM